LYAAKTLIRPQNYPHYFPKSLSSVLRRFFIALLR
jgi:hypothetical protein